MTHDIPVPHVLAALLGKEPQPQRTFPWRPEPWLELMHDLPQVVAVLQRMPERVDRASTRQLVLEEFEAGRTLAAFAGAMVWGYGTTGYGPVRTRWVLTGTKTSPRTSPVLFDVAQRLATGATTVRREGPLEAFRCMGTEGRIKHLGSAFFTKWLYFVSATDSPDDATAAPILDKQVADWLYTHAGTNLRVNRTDSYGQYLQLLTGWGSQYDRSAVQVEKAIFGLATGRD
ncbi:hypothetical protein ACIPYV_16630 [Paenarthrobacter nicotinovorans]|uniref:8-oxoguanine DNA glycosylase OGG fold protein n=1 Tax=Paenarthrobacter nicotinovorans TaxID=29320 RepID=UPI00382DDE38